MGASTAREKVGSDNQETPMTRGKFVLGRKESQLFSLLPKTECQETDNEWVSLLLLCWLRLVVSQRLLHEPKPGKRNDDEFKNIGK